MTKETVLLCQFDETESEKIRAVMKKLNIDAREVPTGSWNKTVGGLLGLKGFSVSENDCEKDFNFPHEVLILYNIKGKRLDEVLRRMDDANIQKIRYKAVVTPYNKFWTLRKLCLTMQKEHSAMAEGKGS